MQCFIIERCFLVYKTKKTELNYCIDNHYNYNKPEKNREHMINTKCVSTFKNFNLRPYPGEHFLVGYSIRTARILLNNVSLSHLLLKN